MENHVSLDLMEFIERNILPRYTEFDKAHSMQHVTGVIRRSLEIARKTGADLNMTYTVAAYHDLGLSGPRAIHHLTSGKILAADVRLKRWFSAEQIRIMKEAVCADENKFVVVYPNAIDTWWDVGGMRDVKFVEAVIEEMSKRYKIDRKRIYVTGFSLGAMMTYQCMEHMSDKYSEHGYIRLWMPHSPNESKLKEIRQLINTPAQLREIFNKLYEEETH